MKIRVLFSLLLAMVVLSNCSKQFIDPEEPSTTNFELYIDFWNPNGDDPQIKFDAKNSSPEVKIDFTQRFEGQAVPPNFTNVIIDNVRIIDDAGVNYHIDEIDAYEWRDDINDWKIDVEFIMQFDQVQDLAVVMVLDASASLGSDFQTVQAYSIDFIDKVLKDNPDARIGIVSFSDQVHTFPLTNNRTALVSYITGIQQGPFTTLYEAMSLGIDMLKSTTAESKALMTFTDGTDNNSDPKYTPQFILQQLDSDPSGIQISSFAIGLDGNGGVDRPVLAQVTVNRGAAAFPKTITELGAVFERFSGTISEVYNFTYLRNQQVIPENSPAKLRFVLESSPKRI